MSSQSSQLEKWGDTYPEGFCNFPGNDNWQAPHQESPGGYLHPFPLGMPDLAKKPDDFPKLRMGVIFSCPEQLNRTHCPSLGQTKLTFKVFTRLQSDAIKASYQLCVFIYKSFLCIFKCFFRALGQEVTKSQRLHLFDFSAL